jgi:hypothetical protein
MAMKPRAMNKTKKTKMMRGGAVAKDMAKPAMMRGGMAKKKKK